MFEKQPRVNAISNIVRAVMSSEKDFFNMSSRSNKEYLISIAKNTAEKYGTDEMYENLSQKLHKILENSGKKYYLLSFNENGKHYLLNHFEMASYLIEILGLNNTETEEV